MDESTRFPMRSTLRSERLSLRSFSRSDLIELHRIFSDPATHTIGSGPLLDIGQTEAWIERRIAVRSEHGLCWYGLRDRAGGELIGNCGVFPGRTGPREPEIGYEVRRDPQGRGYATEAVRAVVDECRVTGVGRLWATVRPHNEASLRVLRRLGMSVQHEAADDRGALIYLALDLSAGLA
jgi:[ribosomal protein S5]-alanine N-acetyltransferase